MYLSVLTINLPHLTFLIACNQTIKPIKLHFSITYKIQIRTKLVYLMYLFLLLEYPSSVYVVDNSLYLQMRRIRFISSTDLPWPTEDRCVDVVYPSGEYRLVFSFNLIDNQPLRQFGSFFLDKLYNTIVPFQVISFMPNPFQFSFHNAIYISFTSPITQLLCA